MIEPRKELRILLRSLASALIIEAPRPQLITLVWQAQAAAVTLGLYDGYVRSSLRALQSELQRGEALDGANHAAQLRWAADRL